MVGGGPDQLIMCHLPNAITQPPPPQTFTSQSQAHRLTVHPQSIIVRHQSCYMIISPPLALRTAGSGLIYISNSHPFTRVRAAVGWFRDSCELKKKVSRTRKKWGWNKGKVRNRVKPENN
jgi:hypothetical protein